jgi:hypothetical protein
VAFAGAFYRALGFGRSIRDAFESAKAELALTKIPRSRGIELFVKEGLNENDRFPRIDTDRSMLRRTLSFECQITILKTIQQTVLI